MKPMVPQRKVNKIAERKLPDLIKRNHALEFGSSCYESGMVEVLRNIAFQDLVDGIEYVKTSVKTKEVEVECEERFQRLINAISEKGAELLDSYDESFSALLSSEATDHYVEGFVRGYKYLKLQLSFQDSVEVSDDE